MEFFKWGEKEKIIQTAEKEKGDLKEFVEKENALLEKSGGFLMNLAPEKYKKKATALLAAFSLFASASSAFAESGEKEITKEKLFPENYAAEIAKESEKNEIAPKSFNIKKIADNITISIGGKIEKISGPAGEAIDNAGYDDIIKTEFYKNFSGAENNEVVGIFSDSFYGSKDAKSFFEFLNNQKENLDDRQKVLFLQRLGGLLGQTYNYDMLENGERVEVSDEKMYEALRNLYINGKASQTGICGNIHTFLTKTAKSLEMEAWLQSGFQKGTTKNTGGNHIFSGLIAEIDSKKQIVFLNYNTLIPTGTLDYRDALGVWERHNESVATFNSYVGDENEILFPVETAAQKEIKKSAGFEKTEEMLGKNLERGEIVKEKGLEINISPESKEIKLSKDSIILSYYNYQNVYNNPYQSLNDLNALRLALRHKGEKIGAEAGVTTVFMNINDLYGGNVSQNDIIGRVVLEGMESRELTKGEWGKLVLNAGATLQAGMRLPMDREIEFLTMGAMGEAAGGARLMYYDTKNNKFYIGADVLGRGQMNDFQNQDLIVKEALKKITVGGSVNVYEATVDIKASGGLADWGKSVELSGAVQTKGGYKLGATYETEKSEYETLKPSSEKIGIEAGWRGPKWGFTISGTQTAEQYKGAEQEKSYGIEAKMNILVF